ncbi:MAG: sugar ABC transporter permease [Chloroflexia bacterium]|nr:sugar ABC transporter permease [Chloroflexia bacterium]
MGVPNAVKQVRSLASRKVSPRASRRKIRETALVYALLSPALVIILGFSFIPMVWSILYSLTSGGMLGEREYVGLANYGLALENPIFLRTLKNTVQYAVLAVPTAIGFSLLVALLLSQIPRFQGLFRGTFYFPVIVPAVVAANVWAYIVNRDFGPLNYVLGWFGISRVDWLGDPRWGIPAIVLMEVWRGFGFYVILFAAAIQAIPREFYEAARLDGASALHQAIGITIPLLRPVLGFAFIMATIWNFQLFDAVYVLTDGGPAWATATVSWYVYQQAFQAGNVGLASTMSVFLLVIIFTLSLVQLRFFRSDVEY